MNTLTDNAIMLKVRAGDLDRMGLLFERYNRQLYGFLFHMTYKREASEDMVQMVFYKMLKYRHTFTGDGEFVAWMYSIARNTIIDEAKKNKKHLHDSAEDMAEVLPSDMSTDGQLERKQEKQELHKAMSKLSTDQREILTMSRFQELKHQEIAQILNITEGAVKVRVHRAMCELKNIYTKMVS
ncbi:RNA polymerase sigma-70 factor (ECF subfamily) [Mucilaginibacter gracilis]|uniref:RNA polymerase sigma-70 factor (ECF subfamily) n=1 Tax=Mucilaginibacter gracilis TaxID=423350 RepID=A0A495J8J4_9SPHI|nr:sigma-70 family RNA polymerase sigma factor [Mucilaginibacter gracilis]RKR84788.1 RNA polymerase sigma-70 factor (ECF subfamily) [Mucilaginibacter gracilis]